MSFINDIQDVIVSTGFEVLKEKGQLKYNDHIIKNELEEYVKREFDNFETVDLDKEIDFENMRIYIIEELLDSFKKCLFGNVNEREQSKKNTIKHLCSYAHADTKEKRQYVENIFTTACKIINHYYETRIIKTEDLYLADKIVDEIHKDLENGFKDALSQKTVLPTQNEQPAISMVQYGDNSHQIEHVSRLTINYN